MYHFASRVLPALFWIKMNRICEREKEGEREGGSERGGGEGEREGYD